MNQQLLQTADDILGLVMIMLFIAGLAFFGGYFVAEEQSHDIAMDYVAAQDSACKACMGKSE